MTKSVPLTASSATDEPSGVAHSSEPLAVAEHLTEKNRLNEAIAAYRKEIALNPNSIGAHTGLGQLLMHQEQWDEALTVYREAVERHRTAPELHQRLGRCLAKTGDHNGAIARYRKAITLDPHLARVYNWLGEALLHENRPDEALTTYRKAVEQRPDAPGPQAMIGRCQAQQGDSKNAIISYRKAIALAPAKAWMHEQLGAALRAQELWKEAAAAYRDAIELRPDAPELHNWLGLCQAKSGDIKNATANYWKEFAINPLQQAELHATFAEDLVRKGQIDDAVTLYQTMIEVQPAVPVRFYYAFADAVQQLGTIDQAIVAYRKAANTHPTDDQGYLRVAGLYASANQPRKAIAAYKKAFDINPDQPWPARHALSDALKRCGQHEAARAYLTSGTTVPSKLAAHYLTLWNALTRNDWRTIDSNPSSYPAQPNPDSVEQYFIQTADYRVVDPRVLTKDHQSVLEQHGISLAVLEGYNDDRFGGQTLLQRDYRASIRSRSDAPPATGERATETDTALHGSLIETGYVYWQCPFSGMIVRSDHSLSTDETLSRGVFRFQGEQPFFLITDDRWTTLDALYLPDSEIIIVLNDGVMTEQAMGLINRFKTTSVMHWHAIRAYLRHDGPKNMLCLLNVPPRWGHDMWSDLAGLDRLSRNGRLQKIDRFLVASDTIHDNLEELFPVIPSDKLICTSSGSQPTAFGTVLTERACAVRCPRPAITQAFAEQLIAVARDHCSASVLTRIEEARHHSLLLWVTLEAGPRQWLYQEAGIENIINHLSDRFPGLGVVFSGTGIRTVTEQPGLEKIRRQQEKAMAEEITHFLNPTVTIYNLFDNTVGEHIVWATAIDLYVAPRATGLTVLPWIVSKPGVVHGNRNIGEPAPDQDDLSLRERVVVPASIIAGPDNATNQETTAANQFAPSDHYDCDWLEIHQALTTIIDTLGLREPSQKKKSGFFRSLRTLFSGRKPANGVGGWNTGAGKSGQPKNP